MKILIFNWRDLRHKQAGGAELYLHEQAVLWAKKGNEVAWLTSREEGAPAEEIVDGIRIYRTGGKFTVYLCAFFKFLALDKPDIIIDVENGIPFFTPFYTRIPKILIILHIHKDVWFKELPLFPAVFARFLEMKVMKWAYKNVRKITISETSRKEARKLFPSDDISIVYSGVSGNCKPGMKADDPELVFIGRLKKYKSIDIFLRALTKVKGKISTVNIIGRGDDEERLKKICSELKLNNVNFLGYVSVKARTEKCQRAWFAVNPSMVEGWSITNIEANACGTPVIGSNVPGIKESIVDGETGLLFEYGDEEELAQKIDYLLQEHTIRDEMSKKAIEWSKKFTWEKSANQFLKLVQDTLPLSS